MAQQAAILESVVSVVAWGLVGVPQNVGRIAITNSVDGMLRVIVDMLLLRVGDPALRATVTTWVRDVRTAYSQAVG